MLVKKQYYWLLGGITLFLLLIFEFVFIQKYYCQPRESTVVVKCAESDTSINTEKPKAMMLLIEFGGTEGLVNMVNDMKQRNVKGVLMINGNYIEKNTPVIKELLKTGVIEIAPSYDPDPFWGMSYDQQYVIISQMMKKAEELLEVKPRIISSRYMAGDENTLKVAQDLGIEYITMRGTTELATTIYKPEEYNVKIISVSNIDVPEFKYGSFCDYSFYERNGTPEDMETQYKRAIQNPKFMAVSHTYIGGYKARWNDMWHRFWDNYEVEWVDLDTLGTVDKVMPMWQIPINKNAPYTPEKIRPKIEYENEENVFNPCKIEDLNSDSAVSSEDLKKSKNIVIFYNAQGEMCVEAFKFLEAHNLVYESHSAVDTDFISQLNAHKLDIKKSKGVSEDYGYYPIIFIKGQAFSGFNKEVGDKILSLVQE